MSPDVAIFVRTGCLSSRFVYHLNGRKVDDDDDDDDEDDDDE
jgi:hypothetical protein